MIHTYLLHYNSVHYKALDLVMSNICTMEKMEGVLMIVFQRGFILFSRICSSSCLFFFKLKFYWHKSLSDASWGTLKFIKRKDSCQSKRISIIQLSSHFSHLWFQPLISRWLYFICSSPCLLFWSWSSIDIKVCQMHLEKHWSLSRGRNPVRAKELDQLFNWIHTLGTLCIFLSDPSPIIGNACH